MRLEEVMHKNGKNRLRFGVCCLLLICAGCGKSGPQRVAVTGKVSYKGAPLKVGTIRFDPVDADASFPGGANVKDGEFTIAAKEGLVPGKYRVSISAPDAELPKIPNDTVPGAPRRTAEKLPAKYNTESKLTADVTPDGPNQLEFTLD